MRLCPEKGGEGGTPLPPQDPKIFQVLNFLRKFFDLIQSRQNAESAKQFDFESMKIFLKGDGLGKFSKSTTRSR